MEMIKVFPIIQISTDQNYHIELRKDFKNKMIISHKIKYMICFEIQDEKKLFFNTLNFNNNCDEFNWKMPIKPNQDIIR